MLGSRGRRRRRRRRRWIDGLTPGEGREEKGIEGKGLLLPQAFAKKKKEKDSTRRNQGNKECSERQVSKQLAAKLEERMTVLAQLQLQARGTTPRRATRTTKTKTVDLQVIETQKNRERERERGRERKKRKSIS